jgi:hypothetical protein
MRNAARRTSIRLRQGTSISPRRYHFTHHNGGNYGSRRTSLAARRSNPDHHFALSLLALSLRMQLEPIRAESPGRTSSVYHPVDDSKGTSSGRAREPQANQRCN